MSTSAGPFRGPLERELGWARCGTRQWQRRVLWSSSWLRGDLRVCWMMTRMFRLQGWENRARMSRRRSRRGGIHWNSCPLAANDYIRYQKPPGAASFARTDISWCWEKAPQARYYGCSGVLGHGHFVWPEPTLSTAILSYSGAIVWCLHWSIGILHLTSQARSSFRTTSW